MHMTIHSVKAAQTAVLFNGKIAPYVQEADDEEGYIVQIVYPGAPTGDPVLPVDFNRTARYEGEVRFVLLHDSAAEEARADA